MSIVSYTRPPVFTDRYWYADHLALYLSSPESPERELPLLLGHFKCKANTKAILYNTEQLTRVNILAQVLERARCKDIAEVWDYSEANIDILRVHGITARHVPLRMGCDVLKSLIHIAHSTPKEYDVGFSGSSSERRERILRGLEETGLRVHRVFGISGIQRDRELAKCRVIINIHYADDYKVFESVRCEPWLAVGVPVISETSIDDDPRCLNVPYEGLVDAVISHQRNR